MSDHKAPLSPPAPAAQANVAPPPLQGPQGSAAQDALLQKRLGKLRQQLHAEMTYEDEDDEELRSLRIEAALEQARDRIPIYDDAKAAYRVVERKAREILHVITETLSSDDPVKTAFATAEVALKRWNSSVRPELEVAAAAANASWYRPTIRDPLQGATSVLLAEFDAAEARITTVGASAFPMASTSSSLGEHKKDAFQFDAAAYIGAHSFSGDGNPKQVLEGYRQWRGKWEAAVKYMRSHFTGVEPSVLLSKLQDTLSGKALDLALTVPPNTADGYESALRKLQGRYDDSFALATAYLVPLDRPDNTASFLDRHEAAENAREQLRVLHPILEEEQMNLLDFMVLRPVFAAMPSTQKADWDAFVLNLKAAHSKESPGVPWRQGMALNSETFFGWSKGFATRHKDEIPQEETCSRCQGHHIDLRCGKDPPRPPLRANSADTRKPATKRPRSELDAALLATTVAKSVAAALLPVITPAAATCTVPTAGQPSGQQQPQQKRGRKSSKPQGIKEKSDKPSSRALTPAAN